jgi:hypothetical protein
MSSPIDRIKAKAMQARGVVPTALASVEAGLDQIIAAGPEIEKKKQEAMAPHLNAIADAKTELDGLKSALDILSNGGPPLHESESSASGSPPVPGLNEAGVKP